MLQEKYGKLRGPPGAAAATTALPQFAEFKTRLVLAKKMTVRDVWGLMLHSVRGEVLPALLHKHAMTFGNTDKSLAKCMLKCYRLS